MNEFVARKGLISLQSASFEEALWVSGSIYSPAEAFLTSSWAENSVTASVAGAVKTDYNKLQATFATSSQSITSTNTWQELIFTTNSNTSSYWVHPENTGQFTCSNSGIYDVDVSVRIQKTTGGNQSAGVHILKNGAEITGSYSAITYTSNNVASDIHVRVIEHIESGSSLKVEIAGTATTIQTTAFPIIGSFSSFSYSSNILIMKT